MTVFTPNDPLYTQQWQYLNTGANGGVAGADININKVWPEYTGKGVKVAIYDDGVELAHRDLASLIDRTKSADYTGQGGGGDAIEAGNSHGTFVTGSAAEAALNGTGGVGPAFGATFYAYRRGFGNTPQSPTGTDDAFANATANADIMNNSWGPGQVLSGAGDQASVAGLMQTAVTTGRGGKGLVVVFAGGNSDQEGDNANYGSWNADRRVITVGALDNRGEKADFSNMGANVLVSSPGHQVWTADRSGANGYGPNDYASSSGTSFAAPMLAGVTALMLEANSGLGYRDVQQILAASAKLTGANSAFTYNSATNWNGGGYHVSHTVGFGRSDAHDAVRLSESWFWGGFTASTAANEVSTRATFTTQTSLADQTSSTVSLTLTPAQALSVQAVEVQTNLTHNNYGDLRITLTDPNGNASVLLDRPGVTKAGAATPDTKGTGARDLDHVMSSVQYLGQDAAGTWTLKVEDLAAGNAGRLDGVTLAAYGTASSLDTRHIYTDEFATITTASRATLIDTAGTDTINAAAVTGNSIFDLSGGTVSKIAGRDLTIDANTVIENAIGGDGSDSFIGNGSNNQLYGGRGHDTFDASGGTDSIWGGDGIDHLVLGAARSTYSLTTDADGKGLTITGGGINTHITGIEVIRFGDGTREDVSAGASVERVWLTVDNPVVTTATGSSGNSATFTVSLSAPATQAVTLSYATTSDIGAGMANFTVGAAGSAYTAASGTLTIAAGQRSGTITVGGVAGVSQETAFGLVLSNISGAEVPAGLTSQTAIAYVRPPADTAPVIGVQGGTASDRDTASTVGSDLIFTVELSQPTTRDVTLDYTTVDGTAKAGSDFTAVSGTLTIKAGDSWGEVVVPVLAGTTPEADEAMLMRFSSANGAVFAGGASSVTVEGEIDSAGISDTVAFSTLANGTTLQTGTDEEEGFALGVGRDSITAGGGDDWIETFDYGTRTTGADWINGGAGTDTLVLLDPISYFTVSKVTRTGMLVLLPAENGEAVVVTGVENFDFAGTTYSFAQMLARAGQLGTADLLALS